MQILTAVAVTLLLFAYAGYSGAQEASPALKESRAAKLLDYPDTLSAFEKITEGMGQEQVRVLLGVPDRTEQGDSGQSWYEALWVYDLQQRAAFPKNKARKAIWTINIMFVKGKVIHTRRIGWLEHLK